MNINPEIKNGIRMVRVEKDPLVIIFEDLHTFDVVTVEVDETSVVGELDRYATVEHKAKFCGVLSMGCQFDSGKSEEDVLKISWVIAGALFRIAADIQPDTETLTR